MIVGTAKGSFWLAGLHLSPHMRHLKWSVLHNFGRKSTPGESTIVGYQLFEMEGAVARQSPINSIYGISATICPYGLASMLLLNDKARVFTRTVFDMEATATGEFKSHTILLGCSQQHHKNLHRFPWYHGYQLCSL